jgi:hypothetical protein
MVSLGGEVPEHSETCKTFFNPHKESWVCQKESQNELGLKTTGAELCLVYYVQTG